MLFIFTTSILQKIVPEKEIQIIFLFVLDFIKLADPKFHLTCLERGGHGKVIKMKHARNPQLDITTWLFLPIEQKDQLHKASRQYD